jgi:hypothetical protein
MSRGRKRTSVSAFLKYFVLASRASRRAGLPSSMSNASMEAAATGGASVLEKR